MNGWMGKILCVNLGSEAVTEIPTDSYAEQFLGGRGIASRIYWERVNPHVGAFEPGESINLYDGTVGGDWCPRGN